MLSKLIRLYHAYMAQDVRSPIPHFAGPPGTGKSQVMQQLADLLGVKLHTVNVARISPLELEGVLMPVTPDGEEMKLRLLHNTLWTQLKEGDIVLLDEFMRGFPEVYNGLLDILTSREVAGFQLPRVFFVAASNSISTYDEALRDRLLHIYVPDIRKVATARTRVKEIIVEELGLLPEMVTTQEMDQLITEEVLPMYNVLDQFKGRNKNVGTIGEGTSVRNLIGQARLREIQSTPLKDLLQYNNTRAMQDGKAQYVVLTTGRNPDPKYVKAAAALKGNDRLTEIQAKNLELNLLLIEMEEVISETDTTETEIPDVDDII